jgi:hypothetical protein
MGTLKEDVGASADRISRALQSSGYRADFSPASLCEIDRFFDDQSKEGAAKRGGLLAADLGSRIFALGCYVGEVLRRDRNGEWLADDADEQGEVNLEVYLPDGTRCWPVQRVIKRLKNGQEDSIAAWGISLGLRFSSVPILQPRGSFSKLFGR